MIIYFADKYMTILGAAGDRLKEGLLITDDLKTSELKYGSDIFEVSVRYSDGEFQAVDKLSEAGGYILRAADGKYECYTILESENETEECKCYLTAESAGLDNINEIVEAYEAPYAMSLRQYIEQISVSVNSGFVMGIDESEGKKKLVFDSAQPAAERYLAIADAFGMELSYSFDIEGFRVVGMLFNFHKKRGRVLERPLRVGHEIKPLKIKKSMLEFASALYPQGGVPSSSEGFQTPSGKYTWVKWSNNANGDEMANTPSSRAYIGIAYYKKSKEKSSDPTDYIWTQIKLGGSYSGAGVLRSSGNYTWIRYSMYADGSSMSANPIGKRYIGIALGKNTSTCSSKASDYLWYPVTEDSADAITLEGLKYDDGDMYVTGKRLVSRSARKVWNRYLAMDSTSEGNVTVDFSSDTKDQNELLQQSIRELKFRGKMKREYSTELLKDIKLRVGDTVPLVDEKRGIYLTARVVKLAESQCNGTVDATFEVYEEETDTE
mgnify:CR=1 FL=1